ncbi:MAG: hypothetical protein ABF535_01490 [Acetobacter sp.]
MIQSRQDRADLGWRQGALARLKSGDGTGADRLGRVAHVQPASLGMTVHQQHDLADMHGDSRPTLLLNLVAQAFETLRRYLPQLELRQRARDSAIIDRSAHRQGAVGKFLGPRLGIGFVLEISFRPSAKRQRLG